MNIGHHLTKRAKTDQNAAGLRTNQKR